MAFCVGCRKSGLARVCDRDGVPRDETGAEWEGQHCPACVYVIDKPVNMSSRKCRKCNARLPVSRYFNCYRCQSSLAPDEVTLFSGEFTHVAHRAVGEKSFAGVAESDALGYLET